MANLLPTHWTTHTNLSAQCINIADTSMPVKCDRVVSYDMGVNGAGIASQRSAVRQQQFEDPGKRGNVVLVEPAELV